MCMVQCVAVEKKTNRVKSVYLRQIVYRVCLTKPVVSHDICLITWHTVLLFIMVGGGLYTRE